MDDGADVLYIHPWGHLNDLVVPAGALSCLNSVRASKLGRYAFEVSDEEILRAKVIAVDVHWALALTGFVSLLDHVRSLRPEIPVLVGGVTAGHYAQELLERYPVDYVLRGDSERSFAALVAALVDGREPEVLPNVHAKGRPPPPTERMSSAELDAADCLTADWFPTYEVVSTWDAVAFPQGRTVPIMRGCTLRCPECVGSYASTFGKGYLMRSPQATARLLRQAERMALRNLRLVLAKPARSQLSALIAAIAQEGPFQFSSAVGFYLCTPPSPEDLRLLDDAFENPVAISFVPPEDHHPALSPARLESEQRAWRLAAEAVIASRNLSLDAWSTGVVDVAEMRARLTDVVSDRVRVSSGAVWSVTRPEDGKFQPLEAVQEALDPVWTFYAARLLSPSLAALLKPFQFLDELADHPSDLTSDEAALEPFRAEVAASWARDRLPLLPSLALAALPVRIGKWAPIRQLHGVHAGGDFGFLPPGAPWTAAGLPAQLHRVRDHRGVELRSEELPMSNYDALILVPCPPHPFPIDDAWLTTLGAAGFLALRAPSGAPRPARLSIHLRVQDARAFLTDDAGQRLGRGTTHLNYFRPVEARARARQASSMK